MIGIVFDLTRRRRSCKMAIRKKGGINMQFAETFLATFEELLKERKNVTVKEIAHLFIAAILLALSDDVFASAKVVEKYRLIHIVVERLDEAITDEDEVLMRIRQAIKEELSAFAPWLEY